MACACVDALAPHVDLGADPRFASAADRAANDAALAEALARVFAERSRHDWQRDLTAADVACVAVTTDPPEVLLMSDEVGRAAGYITDVSHPLFDVHPRLAPVVAFSRSTTSARGADLCGSATDAVLARARLRRGEDRRPARAGRDRVSRYLRSYLQMDRTPVRSAHGRGPAQPPLAAGPVAATTHVRWWRHTNDRVST